MKPEHVELIERELSISYENGIFNIEDRDYISEHCFEYLIAAIKAPLNARIAELEREKAALKAKRKLSEQVTDYNLDHLYLKVADEVIPQTVFNEIVRDWIKELEQRKLYL